MMYQKTLFWIPRGIMIAIIGLFILLDFGVFVEDWKWYEKIIGFFIQLIPVVLMVLVLVLFWKQTQKRALFASLFFFVISVVFTLFFRLYQDVISFFIIGFPVLFSSSIFLLDFLRMRKKSREKNA